MKGTELTDASFVPFESFSGIVVPESDGRECYEGEISRTEQVPLFQEGKDAGAHQDEQRDEHQVQNDGNLNLRGRIEKKG